LVRPSPQTLRRYGLTLPEWLEYAGERCFVCERPWGVVSPVVDHEHIKRWKTMPPEERRKYVRGVPCISCNHFILSRYANPEKLRRASEYLEAYEARKSIEGIT